MKTTAKLLLVSLLLYFLASKGVINLQATARAFERWDLLLLAAALLSSSVFLGFVRWGWLLGAQGIAMPWSRAFQLTMVGNFFNIALPGAVSGDVVKAVYVARESQGQRSRALGSILFDRVAGLSALSILAAGTLVVGRSGFAGTGFFPAIRWVVLLPGLAFVGFYAYLFLVRENADPVLGVLKWAERKVARLGSIVRVYESLRHYHHHRWTVLKVLAVSLVIHVNVCASMTLFLRALGESQFSTSGVFVSVPMGLLFTAIPLAPAGVGTGHAAFGWLLHFVGTERGADVFSLYALFNLLIGALGGLVYLRFRSHEAPLPVGV